VFEVPLIGHANPACRYGCLPAAKAEQYRPVGNSAEQLLKESGCGLELKMERGGLTGAQNKYAPMPGYKIRQLRRKIRQF
jgi:hypothetical protein